MRKRGNIASRLAKIEGQLSDQSSTRYVMIICPYGFNKVQSSITLRASRGPVFLFDAAFPCDPSPLPGAWEYPERPLTPEEIDACIAAWRSGEPYGFHSDEEEFDW